MKESREMRSSEGSVVVAAGSPEDERASGGMAGVSAGGSDDRYAGDSAPGAMSQIDRLKAVLKERYRSYQVGSIVQSHAIRKSVEELYIQLRIVSERQHGDAWKADALEATGVHEGAKLGGRDNVASAGAGAAAGVGSARGFSGSSTEDVGASVATESPDDEAAVWKEEHDDYLYRAEKELESINVCDIFSVAAGEDSRDVKRVLVQGQAGVGKTTMIWAGIAYAWAKPRQDPWLREYDIVLVFPLREVYRIAEQYRARHNRTITEGEIILQLFEIEDEAFPKAWHTYATVGGKKILRLIDGWDEIADHLDHPLLSILIDYWVKQERVVVTTRPGAVSRFKADRKLQALGFSEENMLRYVMMYFSEVGPDYRRSVEKFFFRMKSQVFFSNLMCIPIILELICIAYRSSRRRKVFRGVASLYNFLVVELCRHYIAKQGFHGEMVDATASEVKGHYLFGYALKQLEKLAMCTLSNGQVIIPSGDIEVIFGHDSSFDKNVALSKLGLVRPYKDSLDGEGTDYYFIHLSIQEFLAACAWVRLFVSKEKERQEAAEIYFRINKYSRKHELMWRFVSGLLRQQSSDDAEVICLIDRFFALVEEKPRDLLGARHAALLSGLFSEQNFGIVYVSKVARRLFEELVAWLQSDLRVLDVDRIVAPILSNATLCQDVFTRIIWPEIRYQVWTRSIRLDRWNWCIAMMRKGLFFLDASFIERLGELSCHKTERVRASIIGPIVRVVNKVFEECSENREVLKIADDLLGHLRTVMHDHSQYVQSVCLVECGALKVPADHTFWVDWIRLLSSMLSTGKHYQVEAVIVVLGRLPVLVEQCWLAKSYVMAVLCEGGKSSNFEIAQAALLSQAMLVRNEADSVVKEVVEQYFHIDTACSTTSRVAFNPAMMDGLGRLIRFLPANHPGVVMVVEYMLSALSIEERKDVEESALTFMCDIRVALNNSALERFHRLREKFRGCKEGMVQYALLYLEVNNDLLTSSAQQHRYLTLICDYLFNIGQQYLRSQLGEGALESKRWLHMLSTLQVLGRHKSALAQHYVRACIEKLMYIRQLDWSDILDIALELRGRFPGAPVSKQADAFLSSISSLRRHRCDDSSSAEILPLDIFVVRVPRLRTQIYEESRLVRTLTRYVADDREDVRNIAAKLITKCEIPWYFSVDGYAFLVYPNQQAVKELQSTVAVMRSLVGAGGVRVQDALLSWVRPSKKRFMNKEVSIQRRFSFASEDEFGTMPAELVTAAKFSTSVFSVGIIAADLKLRKLELVGALAKSEYPSTELYELLVEVLLVALRDESVYVVREAVEVWVHLATEVGEEFESALALHVANILKIEDSVIRKAIIAYRDGVLKKKADAVEAEEVSVVAKEGVAALPRMLERAGVVFSADASGEDLLLAAAKAFQSSTLIGSVRTILKGIFEQLNSEYLFLDEPIAPGEVEHNRIMLEGIFLEHRHTPYFAAAKDGNKRVFETMPVSTAWMQECDNLGYNALFYAAICGHLELLNYLIVRYETLLSCKCNGETLLMAVSRSEDEVSGFTEFLEALLSHSVVRPQINLQNERGKTALMLAAENCREKTFATLLRHGASYKLKDNKGMAVEALMELVVKPGSPDKMREMNARMRQAVRDLREMEHERDMAEKDEEIRRLEKSKAEKETLRSVEATLEHRVGEVGSRVATSRRQLRRVDRQLHVVSSRSRRAGWVSREALAKSEEAEAVAVSASRGVAALEEEVRELEKEWAEERERLAMFAEEVRELLSKRVESETDWEERFKSLQDKLDEMMKVKDKEFAGEDSFVGDHEAVGMYYQRFVLILVSNIRAAVVLHAAVAKVSRGESSAEKAARGITSSIPGAGVIGELLSGAASLVAGFHHKDQRKNLLKLLGDPTRHDALVRRFGYWMTRSRRTAAIGQYNQKTTRSRLYAKGRHPVNRLAQHDAECFIRNAMRGVLSKSQLESEEKFFRACTTVVGAPKSLGRLGRKLVKKAVDASDSPAAGAGAGSDDERDESAAFNLEGMGAVAESLGLPTP